MNFLGGKLILWLKSDVEADLKVQEILLAININDQVDDEVMIVTIFDGDDNFAPAQHWRGSRWQPLHHRVILCVGMF